MRCLFVNPITARVMAIEAEALRKRDAEMTKTLQAALSETEALREAVKQLTAVRYFLIFIVCRPLPTFV